MKKLVVVVAVLVALLALSLYVQEAKSQMLTPLQTPQLLPSDALKSTLGDIKSAPIVIEPVKPAEAKPAKKRSKMSAPVALTSNDCEEYQYIDQNGNCKDKPGAVYPQYPYAGMICWIRCLCYEYQFMSATGCGTCSFVSYICLPE